MHYNNVFFPRSELYFVKYAYEAERTITQTYANSLDVAAHDVSYCFRIVIPSEWAKPVNSFTSEYQPKTNVQVHRYNRKNNSPLRRRVDEDPRYCDLYTDELTYTYNFKNKEHNLLHSLRLSCRNDRVHCH